jgi:protein gp37
MGKDTEIQWCDSTVNPNTGCDGCELWELLGKSTPYPARFCYAGPIHEGRLAKSLPNLYGPSFTDVRLAPGRMAKAAAWSDLRGVVRPGKPWIPPETPRLIFVGDMGDVFSAAVPFAYLADELIAAATSPKGARHNWLVLTKRPARMAAFARWLEAERGADWPENVWAGTSVTSVRSAKRIDQLCGVPAAVRFVSFEPLWGPVDPGPWLPFLSWAIVGGQSDQGEHKAKPFDVAWIRTLVGHFHGASLPVFIKQFGSMPFDSADRISLDGPDSHAVTIDLDDSHGGDWSEWGSQFRIREFPAAATTTEAPR